MRCKSRWRNLNKSNILMLPLKMEHECCECLACDIGTNIGHCPMLCWKCGHADDLLEHKRCEEFLVECTPDKVTIHQYAYFFHWIPGWRQCEWLLDCHNKGSLGQKYQCQDLPKDTQPDKFISCHCHGRILSFRRWSRISFLFLSLPWYGAIT